MRHKTKQDKRINEKADFHRHDFQSVMSYEGGKGFTIYRVMRRLLTEEQAGQYIGRTKWGIRELRYKGVLPFIQLDRRIQIDREDLDRLHGVRILIDQEDLDRLITENKRRIDPITGEVREVK